jgi:hypothetical protein
MTIAQQSVHLTLGILRQSQAVFYALAFFWLDGFAVPAPAQVTQTVRKTRGFFSATGILKFGLVNYLVLQMVELIGLGSFR